jgi:hypothetical protein
MTSKEFAEKYAGRKAKVVNYHINKAHNGTIARVIGYDDERVYIERTWVEGNPFWGGVKCVIPKGSIVGSTARFPVENLMLEIDNDDCLDCGAKNDEPCKEDCPNK